MDIITIDPISYRVSKLVENWTSLIWTERYSDFGDFTLVTSAIDYTEKLMPLDTLVSLMDTQEVMIVETHSVGFSDDGVQVLTVTGRSFASILEKRATFISEDGPDAHDDNGNPVDYSNFGPMEYAIFFINHRIGGYEGTESERYSIADIPEERIPGVYASIIRVNGYVPPTEEFADPGAGDVASLVLSTLQQYNLGLYSHRPMAGEGRIHIGITQGRDRTGKSTAANPPSPVKFNFAVGDITSYSYLNTVKDYRNVAYVNSPLGFRIVYDPSVQPYQVVGFNRRVLQVDASDLTDPAEGLTDEQAIDVRGRQELAKFNKMSLIDGEVNPLSKYVFRGPDQNHTYDLGDLVLLLGKEAITAERRITEYIRSQDKTGEKAYPTLADVEPRT